MKTQTEPTKEQQNTATPKVQQEASTGGTATIIDNRPSTIYQRKLQASMNNSPRNQATIQLRETMNASVANTAHPIQRKTPKGSSQFQQIASAMGKQHGVDTSGLKATHNSSFPGTLNAEATIQGNKIHFAPGMDTHYNMRHEVAHAIDNTLNGTPKGNKVVNGQKVDTTREKSVDRMAKAPIQRHAKEGEDNSQRQSIATGNNVLQLQERRSAGAKVGIEIETSLPVRETLTGNQEWELQEHMHPSLRIQPWNPINTKEDLFGTCDNVASKTEVQSGQGWKAVVDKSPLLHGLMHGLSNITTPRCIEIVTDPVSTIAEANVIIQSFMGWLGQATTADYRAPGTGHTYHTEMYGDNTYVYEIPTAAVRNVYPNNELLGNIQINIGTLLEDVIDVYHKNAEDFPTNDRRKHMNYENYLTGTAWPVIWYNMNQHRTGGAIGGAPFQADEESIWKSIMFQYLYYFLSYANEFEDLQHFNKNLWPILRKTPIEDQIRFFAEDSGKTGFPINFRWNIFYRVTKNYFDNNNATERLFDILRHQQYGPQAQVIYNRMFDAMQVRQDPLLTHAASKIGHGIHIAPIDQEQHLRAGHVLQPIHPGVSEIRALQNRRIEMTEWANVWHSYLDATIRNPLAARRVVIPRGNGNMANVLAQI